MLNILLISMFLFMLGLPKSEAVTPPCGSYPRIFFFSDLFLKHRKQKLWQMNREKSNCSVALHLFIKIMLNNIHVLPASFSGLYGNLEFLPR